MYPGDRRRLRVLVLCLPLVLGACTAAGGPGAACAPPELSVTPTKTTPGGPIVITGTAFQDGCNDSFANGRPLDPPAKPLRHITISLVQAGRTWKLATVDAKPDATFTVTSAVPADISPGKVGVQATAGNLRAASLASEEQIEII
jgi:hypothetical protein